jgi:hypothetical protein
MQPVYSIGTFRRIPGLGGPVRVSAALEPLEASIDRRLGYITLLAYTFRQSSTVEDGPWSLKRFSTRSTVATGHYLSFSVATSGTGTRFVA